LCKLLFLKIFRESEKNGLNLNEEMYKEVKELKENLAKLKIQFTENIYNDNTKLLFKEEELEGLEKSFLENLEFDEDENKYKVSLKQPEYLPCMKSVKIENTRKTLDKILNSICQNVNISIIEEIFEIRFSKKIK
jgi:Zn-dependent oligopeptidase